MNTLLRIWVCFATLLVSQALAGHLTVNLTPATGKWRLDSGTWNNSGKTLYNLAAGTYTLSYNSVNGYASPATETITVSDSALTLERSYTQLANFTVNLTPGSAKWRLDGGTWKNSGTILYNLPLGDHLVEYQALSGYVAQPAETVSLPSGATVFNRTLTPNAQAAQLSVTLTPTIAQWRLNGGAWQASGATLTGLAATTYTLEYAPVEGYTTPSAESISLSPSQTLAHSKTYTPLTGSLTISLTPANAQWRVDGGAWQASGATLTGLAAGSHTVEYAPLSGYTSPASESVTLIAGSSAQLIRSYVTLLYSVTSTGVVGYNGNTSSTGSGAYAINLGGTVVGSTVINGAVRGYIYAEGTLQDMGALGHPASIALDLNDSGVVAGFVVTDGQHATRYANGVLHDLGTLTSLPWSSSSARGINSAGVIVGQASASPGQAAFLYENGVMHNLGQWGGNQASALDINDADVIVGATLMADNSTQAIRYENGSVTALPGLGGTVENIARAINNAGVIVGTSTPPASSAYRATRIENGTVQDLGTLGGAKSAALDLNDTGEIVGWAEGAGNASRAFVYQNGIMIDLNSVVTLPPGVVLTDATGINATGQIIANGSDAIGYILTPLTDVGAVSVQLAFSFGQWRVDGGSWLDSGAIAQGLNAGSHMIEYASVNGYPGPAMETVTVNGGRATVVNRSYAAATGQLMVTLTPASGQWRVDGGPWLASGATATTLYGNHTVEYFELSGYVRPATEMITVTAGQLQSLNRSHTTPPTGAISWAGTGTDFAANASWTSSIAPADNLTGNVATFDGFDPFNQPVLAQNRSVRGLAVTSSSWYNLQLTGTGTLTLGLDGIANARTSGTQTVAIPLALSSGTVPFSVASGGITAVTGNLSGPGALSKTGGGTLTLTGASTPANTTVSAGTLSIGNGGATGSLTGNISVASGASIVFNRTQDLTYSGILSGTGTLIKQGGNTLTLPSVDTMIKNITVSAGRLVIPNTNSLDNTPVVTVATGATMEVAWDTFSTLTGGGEVRLGLINVSNASGTFSGIFTGTGTVAKGGMSTWTLTGANTFTGTMSINDGTLAAGAPNTLSPNALLNVGTTVNLLNNNQTIKELASGPTATVNLGSATLTVNSSSTGQIFRGTMTGTGGLKKTGTGTLKLWDSHLNFTGPLQITEGGVAVWAGDFCFPASASVTIDAGAFLSLHDFSYGSHTVGSLAGAGTVNLGEGRLTAGGNNTSTVFSGTITGAGSSSAGLVKTGTGTLTLSGASTYTTPTTITAGTLLVTNTAGSALGTGAVTVGTEATLGGSGNFTGAVTLNGTLSPGNPVGVLTTGSQTWAGDGYYLWEINDVNGAAGTNWDLVNITGNLSITAQVFNTFAINLRSLNSSNSPGPVANFDPNASYSFPIASAASISGFNPNLISVNWLGFSNSKGAWSVEQAGNTLNLVYKPLPKVKVTLTPSSGQWRVNNGAWQASGATVTGLSGGTHTITYSTVEGYGPLPSEMITLWVGDSGVLERTYPPPPAQLTVNLTPAQGQWRLDGGAWQASGATVSGLAAGDHQIEYAEVPAYTKPANETVTLAAGQLLMLDRSYEAEQIYQAAVVAGVHGTLTGAQGIVTGSGGPAQAINDHGVVVGSSTFGNATHAFRYTNGVIEDLGTLEGAFFSIALDINNSGHVAGFVVGQGHRAFRFDSEGMRDLGPVGEWPQNANLSTVARAMNDLGDIVGNANYGLDQHALLHSEGTMHDLGNFGGTQGVATEINDAGVVVGGYRAADNSIHAIRYEQGVVQQLPGLGGTTTMARAISNAGIIVGAGNPPNSTHQHAIRWLNGTPQDLGTLGGNNSEALQLNEAGHIVGWAETVGGVRHAFVYRDGQMIDLNTVAGLPGVVLTEAVDINSLGQIVANTADARAYILTSLATTGSLRVNLTPAAAQWRVNGGPWQASGATVGGLAAGDYVVEYAMVADYSSPVAETVALAAGQALTLDRAYLPSATAQLTVTLTPANARWRLNDGPWQDSGTTLSGLAPGNARIFFQPLAGYSPPANLLITLQAGESRSYDLQHTPLGPLAYSATLIPNPAGNMPSAAYRINNSGAVVGYFWGSQNNYHAYRFSDGTLAGLGTLGGARSYAFGLNNAGAVVGGAETAEGKLHAFLYDAGVMTDLGTLGGNLSSAQDVNDSGVIVGWANFDATANTHAFRRQNGILQDLGTLGGASSRAMGLNNLGVIVGSSQTTSGNFRAFSYQNGTMQNLGTLGGPTSHAYAVNDEGWIVGSAQNNEGRTRAFLLRNDVMENLGTIGGEPHSEAIDINLHGTVVGQSFIDLSIPGRAFVFEDGVMRDLNELVSIPGVLLHETGGINDLGQIVVVGTDYAQSYKYILTPLVTPSSLQLNLTPAAAQWRVNGGAWQASGATVTGLPVGNLFVEFTALEGYVTPEAETVVVSSGQALVLNRSYAPLASVNVTFEPAGLAGQWRLNGGAWQFPATTLNWLPFGVLHTVEFSPVEGFVTPQPQSFTLASGELRTLTANYAPLASVNVTFEPAGLNGQWRLNGGAWQFSATTLNWLPFGVLHTVEFSPVEGFVTPQPQSFTLASGELRTLTANYAPLASVNVTFEPAGLNGQWRLNGGAWQFPATTLNWLPFGVLHTVEFAPVEGFVTPQPQSFTLASGELRTLIANYAPQPTAEFTITDLGTLGGTRTFASAVNLAGMVTGYSYTTGDATTHAFRYDNGVMTNLSTLGGLSSRGFSLNDAGTVVGITETTESWQRGFVFENGVMELIPTLGGTLNDGYGINNLGTITGSSQTANSLSQAFRYRNGPLVDLGSPAVYGSIAMDINDSNRVVGMAIFEAGSTNNRAFLHDGSSMINLGTLGGSQSQANVINNAGVIVGSSRLAGDWAERGFRYQNGLMVDLGTLGGNNSGAYGVNEAGTIVGWANDSLNATRAFIMRNGVMQDLNTLVNLPGVHLTEALGPNDLGQIVANGNNQRAYLLTPVNAPGGLQVSLTPATAQWRVNGGLWQGSGASVLQLATGQHTVEYQSLTGHIAPATENIAITSGRLAQISRAYTTVTPAQISITLTPATGRWRLDGGAWQASGAAATGLEPGEYVVEYEALNGYSVPVAELVSLLAGQSLVLTRAYTAVPPAHLTVTLAPGTGKWRLDSGTWNNSAKTLYNLPAGTYSLNFNTVNGYASPAAETITLASGSHSITRSYTQLANLTLTLTPTTAKWRLDGGTWKSSGTILYNLPLGDHLIEYFDASGATSLAPETVTLGSGSATLTRTLQPPAGP